MFYTWGKTAALQKLGWFGTYYHGTSPTAERAILGGEGLRTAKSGAGWGQQINQLLDAIGTQRSKDLIKTRDAGRVYLSRSKLLAKGYGALGALKDPAAREALVRQTQGSVPQLLREIGKTVLEAQPLEVAGKGLKLREGVGIPGLEVYTHRDIPVEHIRKSKPSRLGNVLRRAVRLRI